MTRTLLLCCAVTLAVLAVGGCAGTVPGLPLPAPLGAAETADPHVVLRAAFTTMFGWRPATDSSPDDAYARARPYLTDELGARARDRTEGGSKTQWNAWAKAGATVRVAVDVSTDEHPPDQPGRVDRVVLINQTVTDPAGRPIDTIDLTAWATLIETEQGWRIRAVRF
ncbi:hypothetical protein [Nocardia gipuzkoensis]|uniref:hypothetical protein n=1 Tax=Nocardia gipuzkoensis TaxID=2749991 RepID=UPI0015EEDE3E|nr:hypothetical protein [Nocardia gipuzkoensis]